MASIEVKNVKHPEGDADEVEADYEDQEYLFGLVPVFAVLVFREGILLRSIHCS